LVSLEVALSTVCLVAAGLLLNSFVRLMNVDKGFDVERVLTANISLPVTHYPDLPQRYEFFRKAIERVRVLPGVIAAGVTNRIPVTGEGSNNAFIPEGEEAAPSLSHQSTDYRTVSEDYLAAIGIPLRQGRIFSRSDRGRPVAVVSTRVAEQYWPGQNPLGKRFHLGSSENPLIEIVGVVGDVRNSSLEKAPGLTVYIPHWQRDRADMILVIRTAMDPAAITQAVRTEIRALDAELPAVAMRTMQEIVSAGVAERRFQLTLVLVFAGVALALASLGIFGVVSYTTAQRRGEMGIRLALGATASDLRSLVLRQGLAPVLLGLVAGIGGALALGRALAGLLYGVQPSDPLTIAGVAVVLFAVSAIACYIPAVRVSRADPMSALHYE
jgi:putative ABC transport system permease protein